MNLANKLTIFRIVLVPLMIIVTFFGWPGEFLGIPTMAWILNLIFIIASITDKLDGYIARSRNQVTTFGKFLDPIADKVLVITAMIILVEMGRLAASIWGKLKTVTQMIAIIIAFIDNNAFGAVFSGTLTGFPLVINILTTLMMSVCVIATIFSGWNYIKNGKDLLKDK